MIPHTASDSPRAVLWDLDGTLIDTAPIHWQAWRAILEREGFDLTWEIFAPTFGQRNDTILRIWLGSGISEADIARISAAKEQGYRKIIRVYPLALLPGAEDCLIALQRAGWRQALATMTWLENLKAIFSVCDFSGYFNAIVTADAVQHGKPDPEVFLRAAEGLGVLPERCIVVEDSPAGIEAAQRANMRGIGIGTQPFINADYFVGSLAELSMDVFDRLVKA